MSEGDEDRRYYVISISRASYYFVHYEKQRTGYFDGRRQCASQDRSRQEATNNNDTKIPDPTDALNRGALL